MYDEEIYIQDFIFSYQHIEKEKYLVVDINNNKIIDYQVKMIMKNDISELVNFNVMQNNERKYLMYKVTNMQVFNNYLHMKMLSKREFIDLLLKVINLLCDSKKYLLKESNFILQPEFMYIDIETEQLKIIYLPVNLEKLDTIDNIRSFCTKLLGSIEIDDNVEDHFLHNIIVYINSMNFSVKGFYELLIKLKNYKNQQAISIVIKNSHKEIVDEVNKSEKVCELKRKNLLENKKFLLSQKAIIIILVQIIFGIIGYISFISKNYLESYISLDIKTVIGIIFIAIGIDIKLTQCLFSKFIITEVEENEETIILKNLISPLSYLLDKNDKGKKIIIDKWRFIVGKLKFKVDCFIDIDTVSRFHAEIIYENGLWYVKDLCSTNGTFVNDMRIEKQEKYSLNNGDTIKFAEKEYVFSLG